MNHTPGPWIAFDDMVRNKDHENIACVLSDDYKSDARLIAAAPEMHAALLEIAGTTANGNSDPDRMADALGEIQGIVRRVLDASKEVPSAPNLAEHVRILREALADNLQAWEGEEESVRDEHAELIEETRAALEATKEGT